MKKVFISTSTFGQESAMPIEVLKKNGYEPVLNPFKRALKTSETVEWLKDAIYLIAGTEELSAKVLKDLPKLKIISRCGVGLDNVDLDYCKEQGILVRNTPQGPTNAVAELTIGLMLSLLRTIPNFDREVRNRSWKKTQGNLLQKKTLGLIGLGNIAKRIVTLLNPFELKVLATDPVADRAFASAHNIGLTDLKTLLEQSDIISIHVPFLPGTKDLIDKDNIKLLKRSAILLNLSRGGIVNEEALYTALKAGQLKGAALDVFTEEPYQGKLTELNNVILTPHIGSYALEARIAQEIDAVHNLLEEIGRVGAL